MGGLAGFGWARTGWAGLIENCTSPRLVSKLFVFLCKMDQQMVSWAVSHKDPCCKKIVVSEDIDKLEMVETKRLKKHYIDIYIYI